MLLNRDTAEGIANGSITLVLRRWDAPRAMPGGTQRTVAGTIRIDDAVILPAKKRVIRDVLEWYKKNHRVWCGWLEIG